ncbi:MAG: hypothetical protein ACR2IM_10570 [Sediminibacterium sp.]
MKKLLIFAALPFFFVSCSKGGSSTTVTPPAPVVVAEPDIAFKVEVDSKEVDYTSYTAALSASQPVNVNVTSAFPKDGVTIDVTVKKDVDNSSIFTDTKLGTVAATNLVTINNLAPGVPCTTTVLVTSKTLDPVSKTYKSLTKTFKIARK